MPDQLQAVDLDTEPLAAQQRRLLEARIELARADRLRAIEEQAATVERTRQEAAAQVTPLRDAARRAETRASQAEAALAEERERHASELDALREELGGELAAPTGTAAELLQQRAAFRQQLTKAHAERRDAIHHAERLQVELDQVKEERDSLAAKVFPASDNGPLVAVEWVRDSPVEGHRINNAVYRGKGPQLRRRPLEINGVQIAGEHTTEVAAPGDRVALPLGVARGLAHAGFVAILDPVVRDAPAPAPRPRVMTVEAMRSEAAALSAQADALESAVAEHEADQDQDQGAGEGAGEHPGEQQ
jgi:hypothetical protein